MEVFVARHPIFDLQSRLYGYDLEFREGFEGFYDSLAEKDDANLQAAVNFHELAGHGKAVILFAPALVARGLPAMFPPELLTVGLPAAAAGEDWLLAPCRRLKDAGYELALDDVDPQYLEGPLPDLADIVRLNLPAIPPEDRRQTCQALAARGKRLLAKGVETAAQLQEARDLGCRYVQGGCFRKPILRPGKEIPTAKLQYLRILQEVHKPELAYDDLEGVIQRDVPMTYKLLRFINSAWYGLKAEVRSIRHALVLLGPAEVRVWASLLVLRDLGSEKPQELFRRSLTRARTCEKLAPLIGMARRASELFLLGMFSLVDALTDLSMPAALEPLPLSRDVKAALLAGTGSLAPALKTTVAYELGDWDGFRESAAAAGLKEDILPSLHLQSAQWADQALDLL